MKIVWADEYYDQLVELIPKAQKRIVILTMVTASGPKIRKLASLLIDAGARGVEVELNLDKKTRFDIYRGRIFKPSKGYEPWKLTKKVLSELQDSGIQVSFTNQKKINPFSGRLHCKATIIDDQMFSFGGINFEERGFNNNDFMLNTKSNKLADYLHALAKKIQSNDLAEDISYEIDSNNQILIDSGQTDQSIIYEIACELAEKSTTIYLVSQMCPSGELAMLLQKTDYKAYFNYANAAVFPANLSIVHDQRQSKIKNSYTKKPYLHAKCILFVDTQGNKSLISGSHNFSWRGVAYGTKEIALYSTDSELWDKLYKSLDSHIF